MFIIYENVYRYMNRSSSSSVIGYVKTENEAEEVCKKLNAKVKEKNNANSMGCWNYVFKSVNYIDINGIE